MPKEQTPIHHPVSIGIAGIIKGPIIITKSAIHQNIFINNPQ